MRRRGRGLDLWPYGLEAEAAIHPLWIDTPYPRFGWKLRGTGCQTAYRIRVRGDGAAGHRRTVWDSGIVESAESLGVAYAGVPLAPHRRYRWTVAVRDAEGTWTVGRSGRFGTAFIGDGPKAGQFIMAPAAAEPVPGASTATRILKPPRYFRRRFVLASRPVHARLYATAAGVYLPYLNGSRVGRAELPPGWTDYEKRFRYQVYDVTRDCHPGENVLGFVVGDGWYAGYVGFGQARAHYGEDPAIFAELHLEFSDGSRAVIATDDSWRAGTGPILYSDLLMGEGYDASREIPGWCEPGPDPEGFGPVWPSEVAVGQLVSDRTPPAAVFQTRDPIAVDELGPGVYLLDFGQNLVGRPLLDQAAFAGPIRLRFGEMRDLDGSLYTENLRAAEQTEVYLGCPGSEGSYRPAFTYHGFRYIEISGVGDAPPPGSIRVEVLHTDHADTGSLRLDEPLLDRLVANILWSQRGNLLFVPTDCPQRDERLGWLGDAGAFIETATWNQDVRRFFADWLDTVADSQSPAGAYPDVAPRLVDLADGAPGWADAGLIVPWTLYEMYGDARILESHYPVMRRYVEWLSHQNPEGLWVKARGNDFGDWLAVGEDTSKDLIATAFFAEDARILACAAGALGHSADRDRYHALHARVRNAYQQAFTATDGRVLGHTQTGYALTLAFGLEREGTRREVAEHLIENLEAHDNLLTTGFLGLPHLLPVLSEAGFVDAAWGLLRETRLPSWGYEIRHGATTIWERWDGFTDERGFQTPGMNSFNHYAFGAVGAWLYRYAAGIRPARPGFREVAFRPHVPTGPARIRARFESVHGRIGSSWVSDGRTVRWDLEVPPNVRAWAELPVTGRGDDTVRVDGCPPEPGTREAGGRLVVPLTSGGHRILFPAPCSSSPS